EALALVGSLDEHSLSGLGVPEVVVTLGSRGCVLAAEHRLVHISADPLDVDPTGAGDAFAAAYVVERSRGQAPRPAAEHATRLVHGLLAGSPAGRSRSRKATRTGSCTRPNTASTSRSTADASGGRSSRSYPRSRASPGWRSPSKAAGTRRGQRSRRSRRPRRDRSSPPSPR